VAYLRTVLAVLWECLRHPFCTSGIDAWSGRVVWRGWPRHTVQSVAETLLRGLEDGSVVLDYPADEDSSWR
jgi:hypothetical protein